MKIRVDVILEEIMAQYGLAVLVKYGWICIEIRQGVYGLSQADVSVDIKLAKHLATHGYHPKKYTPGLWKHESKHTSFTLTVDDFFINYTKKEDAVHLLNALKEQYTISEDWEAKLYCGVTLDWDYAARTCILSIPNYVAMALKSFQHPTSSRAQYVPHLWVKPTYGQKI